MPSDSCGIVCKTVEHSTAYIHKCQDCSCCLTHNNKENVDQNKTNFTNNVCGSRISCKSWQCLVCNQSCRCSKCTEVQYNSESPIQVGERVKHNKFEIATTEEMTRTFEISEHQNKRGLSGHEIKCSDSGSVDCVTMETSDGCHRNRNTVTGSRTGQRQEQLFISPIQYFNSFQKLVKGLDDS